MLTSVIRTTEPDFQASPELRNQTRLVPSKMSESKYMSQDGLDDCIVHLQNTSGDGIKVVMSVMGTMTLPLL
jgi:hypothetical protein